MLDDPLLTVGGGVGGITGLYWLFSKFFVPRSDFAQHNESRDAGMEAKFEKIRHDIQECKRDGDAKFASKSDLHNIQQSVVRIEATVQSIREDFREGLKDFKSDLKEQLQEIKNDVKP